MSSDLLTCMNATELAPLLPEDEAIQLAQELGRLSGTEVYPRSICCTQQSVLFLGRRLGQKYLVILAGDASLLHDFIGESIAVSVAGKDRLMVLCPALAANAAALRKTLPFLVPTTVGLRKSAGCGDRLGLATPGHVRAIRNHAMAPVLAQQSIRECTDGPHSSTGDRRRSLGGLSRGLANGLRC